MSDAYTDADVRDLRTIHLCIPDDVPVHEAEVFEKALAEFVQAPSPREWDPFMYSHTEACEHSDHCYGPGSKAEGAIESRALRDAADAARKFSSDRSNKLLARISMRSTAVWLDRRADEIERT